MSARQIALDFMESERSTAAKNTAAVNPYETRPGFSRRVRTAKQRLEAFGSDGKRPHSRSFENCFEMCDGEAVCWELMHAALAGNADFKAGIEAMGAAVWPHWLRVYQGEPS